MCNLPSRAAFQALFVLSSVSPTAAAAEEGECPLSRAQWARQFGSPAEDQGRAIAVDASGVYVVGGTAGTLPGQASAGDWDAYVRKYDGEGNELWTRQFGSSGFDWGSAISVNASGVYVSGSTRDASFLRKYDAAGNAVWSREVGTGYNVSFRGISLDASGVYVTGSTNGPLPGQTHLGYYDAFVRKYDVEGNEVWTREFGTIGDDVGEGIFVDTSGVYVVGITDLGSHDETRVRDWYGFVRKYDAAGNDVWTQEFRTTGPAYWGGMASVYPSGISVGASGIYVVGITDGSFQGYTNLGGYEDIFVLKYDLDGNEVWTREFGTPAYDDGTGIAVDASGVYVAGWTGGTLPGQASPGDGDAFVRKYDADGNEVWTRQFGTAAFDLGLGIAVDASGIYMAGITGGTLPGQASAGGFDAFVDFKGVGTEEPPSITCPANMTLDTAPGQCDQVAVFAPTTNDNCPGATTSCDVPSASTFPRGTTTVTCTATDSDGNNAVCSFTVTVEDHEPPNVTVALNEHEAWPPNHRMVPFAANLTFGDNCAADGIHVEVLAQSNEPDDAPGDGDGNTINDVNGQNGSIHPVLIREDWSSADGADTVAFSLRAERDENGTGRIYTVLARATDDAGNASASTDTVSVPVR
jgi:hypothetical protein